MKAPKRGMKFLHLLPTGPKPQCNLETSSRELESTFSRKEPILQHDSLYPQPQSPFPLGQLQQMVQLLLVSTAYLSAARLGHLLNPQGQPSDVHAG